MARSIFLLLTSNHLLTVCYTAVGILGATVMPHALFLGSYLATQDRIAPAPTLPNPVSSEAATLRGKVAEWFKSLITISRAERIAASREYRDKYGRQNNELTFVRAHLTHGLVDVIASLLAVAVPINSAYVALSNLDIASANSYVPRQHPCHCLRGVLQRWIIRCRCTGRALRRARSDYGAHRQRCDWPLFVYRIRCFLTDGITYISAAAFIFALALLCAGQTASITATLAGQIVSEGFLEWRVSVSDTSGPIPYTRSSLHALHPHSRSCDALSRVSLA